MQGPFSKVGVYARVAAVSSEENLCQALLPLMDTKAGGAITSFVRIALLQKLLLIHCRGANLSSKPIPAARLLLEYLTDNT